MSPNPHEITDLVTFTEKIFDGKLNFWCKGYIIVLEPKKLCFLFEMIDRTFAKKISRITQHLLRTHLNV